MKSILDRPLYEDRYLKEVLLLGEDELQRLIQEGRGKGQDVVETIYRSTDDQITVEKTFLNSDDVNFPLEKELDTCRGMDNDHVLTAFKEYVTMIKWVKDFLRNKTPFPNNLKLQDVLKYINKIRKKYKTDFLQMGLIGFKNVNPATTPQSRTVDVGTNNDRNFVGVATNSDRNSISVGLQENVQLFLKNHLIFLLLRQDIQRYLHRTKVTTEC